MSQLDLFTAPAMAVPPTSYARTWRAHRLFARVMVSKSGEVWCFGCDLHTRESGEGFAPMPHMNRHESFEAALEAGMTYITGRCRHYSESKFNDAPDYGRLLRMIEKEQPELHESWQADDEIQDRWAACERAGLIDKAA